MRVSELLRILQLNLAYDGGSSSPTALLTAYHTLTGWSRAVSRAGAVVHTVQRFSLDARVTEADLEYVFVADGPPGTPDAWDTFNGVVAAVVAALPDVVHVNGLMFPGMLDALREELPAATTVVLQDHSGAMPRRLPWPIRSLSMARWQRAFAGADACTFTAVELAERWHPIGLPREMPIVEIPEASADLVPTARDHAMRVTGIDASPAILWVGRLDANKDPLTALDALDHALPRLPGARCWMVYAGGDLEPDVRRRIDGSSVLRNRVDLVGVVSHQRMADYYSAADIFLSASHHEGSGYALIESMACGVSPCVTDIPAFRALAGSCGASWRVGDASGCARALLEVGSRDRDVDRRTVRRRFEGHLSWDVVGRRTVAEYQSLVNKRRR